MIIQKLETFQVVQPISDQKKEQIMLVDDTLENIKLVSGFLIEYGFEILVATNGKQALKKLEKANPDIILLDVVMPEMNGFETCRNLKLWEKTKDIPVIFMTAITDSQPKDKIKGLSLGAVDYISKPIQLEEVLARVKIHLHLRSLTKQLQEQNALLCQEISAREAAARYRQQVEEQLRQSEERWQLAIKGNNDGIWDWNIETNETDYSFYWKEILGYESHEIRNNNQEWLTRIHPDDFDLVMAANQDYLDRKVSFYAIEYRLQCKDGTYKWVMSRGQALWNKGGKPVRMVGSTRDITARKQAEAAILESEAREREKATQLELALAQLKQTQAQLIQTEKMSSLGQMVAGIAHEINNPVSFIHGNLTLARQYFQDILTILEAYQKHSPNPPLEVQQITSEIDLNFLLDDWRKLMNSMAVGAERIQEIVRSLLLFSRLNQSAQKPVDIHQDIDNTLFLLQHRLRAEGNSPAIEVIKHYTQLPLITCYASQLNQVWMNLLSNAIDVLKTQSSPRVITINTEIITNKSPQPTAQFVVIRIADNGPGMDDKILTRIFDPFFTTKPVGSGAGLGLSISYQIVVEKHRGKLSCLSTPGQGTEFIIEIPLH